MQPKCKCMFINYLHNLQYEYIIKQNTSAEHISSRTCTAHTQGCTLCSKDHSLVWGDNGCSTGCATARNPHLLSSEIRVLLFLQHWELPEIQYIWMSVGTAPAFTPHSTFSLHLLSIRFPQFRVTMLCSCDEDMEMHLSWLQEPQSSSEACAAFNTCLYSKLKPQGDRNACHSPCSSSIHSMQLEGGYMSSSKAHSTSIHFISRKAHNFHLI